MLAKYISWFVLFFVNLDYISQRTPIYQIMMCHLSILLNINYMLS